MTAICQAGMPVLVVDVVERGACPAHERVECCSSDGHGKADAVTGAQLKRQNAKAMNDSSDDMLLVSGNNINDRNECVYTVVRCCFQAVEGPIQVPACICHNKESLEVMHKTIFHIRTKLRAGCAFYGRVSHSLHHLHC